DGIVLDEGEDYFASILKDYLALSRAQIGQVGPAPATLIQAADIVAFGARWMTDEFGARTRSSL
ncbi:MAG: aminoglycoside 3-N-acetyltransferase, partial [Pseudomonadota bacterium]